MGLSLFIASDHAGFEAKEALKKAYSSFHWIDKGPSDSNRVDYPFYAQKLCRALLQEQIRMKTDQYGILICGTGIGMSMAANRFKDIRAAHPCSAEEALLAKEHNNANVLCFGARTQSVTLRHQCLEAWLDASFLGDRHLKRIEEFNELGTELL